MANHEERPIVKEVDLFLAFARKSKGDIANKKCIRTIIRDYDLDLKILETKLKIIGGTWRIHKTINKRDVTKARIWMLHKLIETSQFDGCIDSLWRTALLQSECKAEKNFLLDVDTKNITENNYIISLIPFGNLIKSIPTPNGWHYITKPFDTREVCKLPYVTLIRDGYIFIKKVEK